MSKVKISVRGDGDIATDDVRQFAFDNWEILARVLTGRRLELLRYARRHKVASVRALATALSRDYRNVHTDVRTLINIGLLERTANGLRVDYDPSRPRLRSEIMTRAAPTPRYHETPHRRWGGLDRRWSVR
jgi:predicted transcriptional regulator